MLAMVSCISFPLHARKLELSFKAEELSFVSVELLLDSAIVGGSSQSLLL